MKKCVYPAYNTLDLGFKPLTSPLQGMDTATQISL